MPPRRSHFLSSFNFPLRSLTLIAATVLVVAACGEKAETSVGNTTGAPKETNITVRMKEWVIEPSATTAPAGSVTFKATNTGTETHEMVLFKTDLAPENMPVDQDGAVDERGAGIELIDEVEDVKPGQLKQFTATLAPGKYVMACNVVENGQRHFMNKMYTTFTVTA